jgi:surface antigen
MRKLLLAGAAALLLSGTAAVAQPSGSPPGDPDGYYSQSDRDGYYDRSGRYHRYDNNGDDNGDSYDDDAAPPPPYREGAYEDSCRSGNTALGTIFGALAGGLIGNAAGHGNGGAVVGGAILGGLLGNAVARDMPCEDHPHAFRAYSAGLNGDLGRRYEWRNGRDYGTFTPEREFHRGGTVCRSWSETSYARGRSFTRTGTACRRSDGNWHFDD